MIREGDRILVAFSGGKDSFVMLNMLEKLRCKSPVRFELIALTIDTGFPGDFRKAEKYLENMCLAYHIYKSTISTTVESKIKSHKTGDHCFLCARIRRSILSRLAKEHKCNKIALGHNLDDAIETLLLNIFYGHRNEIMRPNYKAGEITIIRPLIYTPEKLIENYSKKEKLPVVKVKCPFDPKDSKRIFFKKIISKLSKHNPLIYSSARSIIEKAYKTG